MKPIAIFVVVAAFSVATVAATAKTVNTSGSTNDRMVAGVAGPVAAADTSQHKMKMKMEAKKAKTRTRMAAIKRPLQSQLEPMAAVTD